MASATVRREPTAGDFDDARWPAHLHINVAARARGIGAADGLMERWFDRLRAAGSPGCYLQTLVENTRAVRFFERMGLPGMVRLRWSPASGTAASDCTQQTMVWSP
jgi:GNAT superfamily N-acetyltransferase